MDDNTILAHIDDLVAEEKVLREKSEALDDGDQARLQSLEEQLDQSWDLLRQRRAQRDAGEDPGLVQARPVDEVERYIE